MIHALYPNLAYDTRQFVNKIGTNQSIMYYLNVDENYGH